MNIILIFIYIFEKQKRPNRALPKQTKITKKD